MNKQETIKKLTDLMGVICNAYWKGKCDDIWSQVGNLRVHESYDACISIDLYHFEGDGKDVCEGLHDCAVTFDDGTTAKGWLFCMAYNPDDEVTPLVFEFTLGDDDDTDRPCDIDVDPEDVPEDVLRNVLAWLEAEMQQVLVRTNTNNTNLTN